MKEIIQLAEWRYKFRRNNKKGYYNVIKRRDNTFFCSCPSHMFNAEECKHIKLLKQFLGEPDDKSTGQEFNLGQ